MIIRRILLTAVAIATLLPASGCGCRRSCNSNSNSFAPPPGCCDKGIPPGALPPGALPPPGP